MSRLDARMKRRFGYLLYMAEMLRVWATHTFPLFEAEFVPAGIGKPRTEQVSQLLAVRIRDFGGMLHRLAPGASIRNSSLRLLAFKTRKRLHYFRFVIAVLLGRQTFFHAIELLDVVSVECRAINGSAAPGLCGSRWRIPRRAAGEDRDRVARVDAAGPARRPALKACGRGKFQRRPRVRQSCGPPGPRPAWPLSHLHDHTLDCDYRCGLFDGGILA